ncbi:MAG: hypothetical protein ACOC31_02945 [Bacteroidota bacterium]
MNRRNFIKNTTLTTAGMMFMPSVLQAEAIFSPGNSENKDFCPYPVTLISVIEGSSLLAFISDKMNTETQNALLSDIHVRPPANKGRMAGVLPPLDKRLMTLLRTLKSNPDQDNYLARLSVAMGWAARNATHLTFHEFFNGKDQQQMIMSGIHMDAVVLRNLSLPDYNPSQATKEDMEELLNIIVPRAITRTHTIKPDMDDGMGWVNRMSEKRRNMKKRFSDYASAIVNPDQGLLPADFYKNDDTFVTLAHKLQKAQDVTKEQTNMISDPRQSASSLYGKALKKSTLSLFAINDYLENKTDEESLETMLFA